MKIIHLLSTNEYSGAENVACQIISLFSREKNIEMFYVSEIKGNKKYLEDRSIPYIELKKFSYSEVKRIVEQTQPDVIHAHDIKASIIASAFCKRCKIVSHIHSNHENMRKINLKTILYKFATKRISKIIWVSDSAYENYVFKKGCSNKSLVLYNIIDKNSLQRLAAESKRHDACDVLYLGRLSYPKNPVRFLEIIKQLKRSNADIKALMVGDGEYKDKVLAYIKQNKLSNNVFVLGKIQNPYGILQNAKILVMTSRFEGTPMSALEAISMSKPIVSTKTDGLIKIINNYKSGVYSDDDKELANAIKKLINDQALYRSYQKEASRTNDLINNKKQYLENIRGIYYEN